MTPIILSDEDFLSSRLVVNWMKNWMYQLGYGKEIQSSFGDKSALEIITSHSFYLHGQTAINIFRV